MNQVSSQDVRFVRFEKRFVVSDLGETIGDLELSGFEMTDERMARIEAIAARYGVSIKDCELYVEGSKRDVAGRMDMLIQAMAAVDGMYDR